MNIQRNWWWPAIAAAIFWLAAAPVAAQPVAGGTSITVYADPT